MDRSELILFDCKKLYAPNPVILAEDLVGTFLIIKHTYGYIGGKIVETEAYWAPKDKASHAYQYKRTARTSTMFEEAGTIYIYLVYGLHHLFNIVTGPKNEPHAVLIRAIEPIWGKEVIKKNRPNQVEKNRTNGPGKWTQAVGINMKDNKKVLNQNRFLLYQRKREPEIQATPRVGIDYAQEYKTRPWRFIDKNSKFVSK